MAKERGTPPLFDYSNWGDTVAPTAFHGKIKDLMKLIPDEVAIDIIDKMETLVPDLIKFGIRNLYLGAIAPTGSISLIGNQTSGIEAIYKRKWFEENITGLIPVIAPGLSVDTYSRYIGAYDLNPHKITRVVALAQCFVDQAISFNSFYTKEVVYSLHDKTIDIGTHISMNFYLSWKLGVKSNYYLRSQSPEELQDDDAIDRSMECQAGCQ